MNMDRASQVFTLVTNIAVLLGILLLLYELQQTNNLAKTSAQQEIAHDLYTTPLAIATDEGLAEALYLFNSGQETTPIQEQRLKTLAYATNAIYDNIYFQYRQDMVTEDQWRASLNSIKSIRREKMNPAFYLPDLYSEPYQQLIVVIDAEVAGE